MLADFGAIGLFLIFSFVFAATMPLVTFILTRIGWVRRKPNPVKNDTYECGLRTIGRSWVQFNFRYYFYALLFVLFDVLVIFLYPWAVGIRKLGLSAFVAVSIFVAILLVGYLYAWKKRALEWQ
ncbi:MAG: NADH-quinone oxidoreductase subunit A [Dehalococcoidia bacterium]|nr:NADH-quinone oxidoreductase subunit A [Dehalococcoidia bacterium]